MPFSHKERQDAVYGVLLRQGSEWISMREIAMKLDDFYPDFAFLDFHNSAARRMITADIEAINSSHDYEKVIISGNYGIKLADRTEYERFIKSEFTEIFRKLKRIRKMAQKAGLDGQSQIWGEIREAFQEGS